MATELAPARGPDREKATRIVEAMRASVAERGIAGSTFDQVARAAGVSRGLLHYYFGSKERLLVEAVRLECDLRDELLARQRFHATPRGPRVVWLPMAREEVTYFKVFELPNQYFSKSPVNGLHSSCFSWRLLALRA